MNEYIDIGCKSVSHYYRLLTKRYAISGGYSNPNCSNYS